MASTFQVDVVTPDGAALAVQASSLTVPAWEGYLGVLRGHAPLLTVLKAGLLTVKADDKARYFAVKGGFMEVSASGAKVLADDFKDAAKLKRTELEAALKAAEAPLGEAKGDSLEARAAVRADMAAQRDLALAWAKARLQALDAHEGKA